MTESTHSQTIIGSADTATRPLTIGQAATRLGVHVETVRRWCDEGKLPSVRTLGGHRRIPADAIDALTDIDGAA